jgi:hypothetical protein
MNNRRDPENVPTLFDYLIFETSHKLKALGDSKVVIEIRMANGMRCSTPITPATAISKLFSACMIL